MVVGGRIGVGGAVAEKKKVRLRPGSLLPLRKKKSGTLAESGRYVPVKPLIAYLIVIKLATLRQSMISSVSNAVRKGNVEYAYMIYLEDVRERQLIGKLDLSKVDNQIIGELCSKIVPLFREAL